MEIFNIQFNTALGYTLIHSIWQATIIAILMTLTLFFIKKESAKTRYLVSITSLFVQFGLSVFTFFYLFKPLENKEFVFSYVPANINLDNIVLTNAELSWLDLFYNFVSENLQWIIYTWAIGMFFFLIRILIGLNFTKNLYKSSRKIEQGWINNMLQNLKEKAFYYSWIDIRETIKINSPSVSGWLKPCIYFPVGLINQISPSEAEAILAHELAHILRNDYIINIFQSVIEAFFYFHPAIWWISANIRNERENASDDLAIQIIGDKIKYAKSLVYLQEWENTSQYNLTMNLANKNTPLFTRIKRILNKPENRQEMKNKIFASLILLSSIIWISASDTYNASNDEQIIENVDAYENEFIISTLDTIPPKTNESKSTIIELKNGKIQSLEINGEKIPESEFDQHQNLIQELKINDDIHWNDHSMNGFPRHENMEILRLHEMEGLDRMLSELDIVKREMPAKMEKMYRDMDQYRAQSHTWNNDNFNFKMDTLKVNLDSLKLKMKDFYFDFDFPEMANDVKIYLDSFNFPKMAFDVQNYLDSIDFKKYGNEFRIAMDSMHFENLYKDLDSLRMPKFDHFFFNYNNNLESKFIKELKKDDLYIDGSNNIELKIDQLKINGKVQSSNLLERYKNIYEETTGTKLLKGSSLNIEIEENIDQNQYNYKKI